MNRKGQVFLLLTLLVLTFMISISAILFDIKKAEYMEPSPDFDETMEVWENSVEAIEQIFSILIAINSKDNVTYPDGNYNNEVSTELAKLEYYLNSRGFAATILLLGNASYIAPTSGLQTSFVSLSGNISIYLSSISGTEIRQVINLTVIYNAVVTASTLLITKSVVGPPPRNATKTNYLSSCTFNVTGLTDLANGAYTHTILPDTPFIIRTPNTVELQVTTPT